VLSTDAACRRAGGGVHCKACAGLEHNLVDSVLAFAGRARSSGKSYGVLDTIIGEQERGWHILWQCRGFRRNGLRPVMSVGRVGQFVPVLAVEPLNRRSITAPKERDDTIGRRLPMVGDTPKTQPEHAV
jgi:hypothetical protein